MYTRKYGNVHDIWVRTGGKCHLCHEHVDLDTYGLLSAFGSDAASVDHLIPQSHGGGHYYDNLRIAHQGCNSRRGTRDPVEVRRELSGRAWEPLSSDERVAVIIAITAATGVLGAGLGAAIGNPRADPTKRKQAREGAVVGGILLGFVGLFGAIALTQ
ncbi:HNH endonuclease [Nannocystis pusilla]|uniref:HNH endonuclease n=1 Tax=Nannocystis pusilla TaxID=889268 RepID=UPI003DA63A24